MGLLTRDLNFNRPTTIILTIGAIMLAIVVGYVLARNNPMELQLMGAVLFIVMLFFSVRNRRLLPIVLVFALGFEQFSLDPSGQLLTFSKISGALVVGLYLLSRQFKHTFTSIGSLLKSKQFIFQLLFVLYLLVNVVTSIRPDATVGALPTYLQLLVLTWLVVDATVTEKDAMFFSHAIVLYGIVLALLAIVQFEQYTAISQMSARGVVRAESINENPNIAARYMVFAMGVLLAYLTTIRNWRNFVLVIGGATVLLLGIFSTASRGGVLAVGVLLLFALIVFLWRLRLSRVLFVVLSVVSVVAAIFYFFPQYPEGIIMRFTGAANPTGGRTELIEIGLRYFSERPLMGVGLEAFRYYDLSVTHRPSHNTYVGLLAETGIIGFMLFISFLGLACWNLWSAYGRTRRFGTDAPLRVASLGLLLGLTAMGTAMFFGDAVDNKMFWLALALAVAVGGIGRSIPPQQPTS